MKKALEIAALVILVALAVFFFEPMAMTNMVYGANPTIGTWGFWDTPTTYHDNPAYVPEFHYTFYFENDVRASEEVTGTWKCAETGKHISIGSIVVLQCQDNVPIVFSVWKYQMKYHGTDIWLGYKYLIQKVFNP